MDRTTKAYLVCIKKKIAEGYNIEEINAYISYLMHNGCPWTYERKNKC